MSVHKKVVRTGNGWHAAAVVITLGLSCSPGADTNPTRRIGGIGGGSSYGNIAHAAEPDAGDGSGVGGASQPVMPDNPSHISLRFPKVPKVLVTLNSGEEFPYYYEVAEEGDNTVVTLYLPQGAQMGIAVAAIDGDGKPVAEPVLLTVEPEAKLGTETLVFGATPPVVVFTGKYQNQLVLGDNFLQGPISSEFICAKTREIMQGIYMAEHDHVCRVDWTGSESLFAFLDGPPVCHKDPFEVTLKAGQKLGLYPVFGGTEGVGIRLEDPDQEE